MSRCFVVLLAGGIGSRLAPLSTPDYPKQFLKLPGMNESLLQQAARAALELVPAEQVITVTFAHYAAKVSEQLQEVNDGLLQHRLIEPSGAGTAAAATVAALYAQRLDVDASIWLLPCDHDRRAPLELPALMPEVMQRLKESRATVMFGVRPHEADCGFGYLLLSENGKVARFVEKPDAALAAQLLASGQAWWNSGMFAFSAETFTTQMQQLNPVAYAACEQALADSVENRYSLFLPDDYGRIQCPSIDYAVMERTDALTMIPLPGGWADVGTWPRLAQWWQTHAPDVPDWDFGSGREVSLSQALQQKAA